MLSLQITHKFQENQPGTYWPEIVYYLLHVTILADSVVTGPKHFNATFWMFYSAAEELHVGPLVDGYASEIQCWGFGSVIQALCIFFLLLYICLGSLFAHLCPASHSLSHGFGFEAPSLKWCFPCSTFSFDNFLTIFLILSLFLCLVWHPAITPDLIHLTVCPLLLSLLWYSERFFVRLNKSGLPKSPEKTERQCTLFVVSR